MANDTQFKPAPTLTRRGYGALADQIMRQAYPGMGKATTLQDIRQNHQGKLIQWSQGITTMGMNLQIVGSDTVGP
jgi:hypothetical protein